MAEIFARLAAALADRYTIELELGAGGMATVYLAEDVRHHRKVAVKVLRPELAAILGAERFLKEIEVTANLQHPHILPLHDSGEVDSFLYYVMPYAEGESLRERLNRDKQLGVEEAVRITESVAAALDHAHRHDIVHRDIKPENILLQDGQPVVADFGIALAVTTAGATRLTETGLSLGTPQYMSPEQVTGDQNIGPPSDTYALATVLYEMLAGDPPFTASTPQAVIGRIMSEEPVALSTRRTSVPANVDAAVRRGLEKVPADRFATAGEFARALTNPVYRYGNEEVEAPRGRSLFAVGVGLGLAIGVGSAWLTGLGRVEPGPSLQFGSVSKVTFATGLEINPALSPDGREVAYVSVAAPRQNLGIVSADSLLPRIMVKPVEGGASIALSTEAVGAEHLPTWNPDGGSVLFLAARRIYSVSARGGIPRAVAPASGEAAAWPGSWSPDGREYAYVKAADGPNIIVARSVDGVERVITEASGAYGLRWSPDGRWIAFVTGNTTWMYPNTTFGNVAPSQIFIVEARGGEPIPVTDVDRQNVSPAWLSGDRLLFVSSREGSRDIFMVGIGDDGRPTGEPARVTAGLAPHSIGVSLDGSRLAYSTLDVRQNVYSMIIPRAGIRSADDATAVTVGQQIIEGMAISPDGEWIAFDSDRSGNQDIYRRRIAGGETVPLTTDPQDQFVRSWPGDAEWLVGHGFNGGDREIVLVSQDGLTLSYPTPLEGNDRYPDVSPDGRRLVFQRSGGLFMIERNSGDDGWGDPVNIVPFGTMARWSPDGTRIAFREGTPPRILVVVPGEEPEVVYAEPDSTDVRIENVEWHDGGNRLLFLRREAGSVSALWSIGADGTGLREAIRFEDPARQPRLEMAVHGETVYFTIGEFEGDIWVVDLKGR